MVLIFILTTHIANIKKYIENVMKKSVPTDETEINHGASRTAFDD